MAFRRRRRRVRSRRRMSRRRSGVKRLKIGYRF